MSPKLLKHVKYIFVFFTKIVTICKKMWYYKFMLNLYKLLTAFLSSSSLTGIVLIFSISSLNPSIEEESLILTVPLKKMLREI